MLNRLVAPIILSLWASLCSAQGVDINSITDKHILPSFTALAQTAEALNTTAQTKCQAQDTALRAAFSEAFDAWILASHLRFGPTETDDRAFALAFWPDSRGATPKTLNALIAAQDSIVENNDTFDAVSIAARGFYALEFLLYDPAFATPETADYRCKLLRAITTDISANTAAIVYDWEAEYAALLRTAGKNDLYHSEKEAAQELFKAMLAGLQFTSETRLGRPMGSYERPRPKRAEARRSNRSLHHVVLSLRGTYDLAMLLSENDPKLEAAYTHAFKRAELLNDPVFAAVTTPQGRFRIEVLQQAIDDIRNIATEDLGPRLGVAAGFNSLDGD